MTSPLHGENQEFESLRAHRLFFQSGPTISAEAKDILGEELCNYPKKLCNFRALDNIQRLARQMTDRYFDDEGNEQIEMLDQELIPEEAHDIDWNDPSDPYALKAEAKLREALKRESEEEAKGRAEADEAKSDLSFTKDELDEFVIFYTKGLADKSKDWPFRSAKMLWTVSGGKISYESVNALRDNVLKKYENRDSHSKVLRFTKSFFEDLAAKRDDSRYASFNRYLKPPKALRERKRVTKRIVTKEDIENILSHVKQAEESGSINAERAAQYKAYVIFGACTGQRSEATIAKLTAGQFREAMRVSKPVLVVDSSQDKIKMSHYVPLHPMVIEAIKPLLAGRNDDELMFTHSSVLQWMKRQEIPMSRFNGHFVLGDLRKFAEQHGDVIEWDQSNRAYILTHGVSGVSWSHYRNPLPENVYDIYMRYWRDVDLTT